MRQRAVSARQALSRHPWAIGLMESRTSPGAETLRHHDAILGVLRDAGFSIEMAAHTFSALEQARGAWSIAGGPEPGRG